VGDDGFREALQVLQRDHRFGKIGSDDVRAALEAASGLDLRAYFAEWVYGTRVPELRLASRSRPAAEGYRTEITVHGSDLPGQVPLGRLQRLDLGRPARAVLGRGAVVEHALDAFRFRLPGGDVLLGLVEALVPVVLLLGALLVRRLLLLRARLVRRLLVALGLL